MAHAFDILNWFGSRKHIKLPGRFILPVSLTLGLPRLLRIAGRRVVSGSAGAPAMLLTSGNIENALKDPELLYRAMEFTVQEMKLDTFCTIADLSLEAEACGCQVEYHICNMPSVITHPFHNRTDLSSLPIPDPDHDGRMPLVLDVLARIKRNYSLITAAIITGPFTLSLQLYGSAIYVDTIRDPEKVSGVMGYSAKLITKYADSLAKHGADMIIVAEPAVSQLSPRVYERFAYPYIESIAMNLTRPAVLHICGKAEHLVDYMCQSSYIAFSVDEVDIENLGKKLPHNAIAVGNISPLLLRHGSITDIIAKTDEILVKIAGKKEVIVAPGCDLAPDTPLENILAFVNAAKR